MRRSVPLLVAVGSCVSACQGSLDLGRYSFEPAGGGAGGGVGSAGVSGEGGSSNAGASSAGTGGAGGASGGSPGGGAGGTPTEPEQAVAVFDHYRFARDAATYTVGAEAGLLLNDPGALTAVPGVVTTERGGSVNVAADGGFAYTPAAEAWGDDFFDYTLAESQSQARVRLTLTPGTVPLGDVAGNADNGFVILGAGMNAALGGVVAGGGDVNGDGRADLLVSVSGGDVAYVVFGKSDAAPVATLDLAPMSSSPAGFVIVPSGAYPQAGYSLAGAGDVNGDGLDDILVGTASFNIAGSAYVVFGKTTTETVDLAALDAGSGGGFAIVGAAVGDAVGLSVSGAGDVNGDGLADVLVGATGTENGTAYVVFGKATPEPFSLGLLNGELAGGFAVTGPPDPEGAIAGSASSVAGVGDVNGDGLSDVAFNGRQAATSVAYVVFGKRDTQTVSVTALGGVGFSIDNGASVGDGTIVSAAGDVNGDGFADLVLGDDAADPSLAGAAYVVFGKPNDVSVDFAGLKAGMGGGFVIQGGDDFDNAGGSVAGAGDFDADGFADLIVGADNAAPGGGASKGKAYLVWGTPGTTTVQLSDVEAELGGVAIEGAFEQDFAGSGVASAGDVDGDGMLDLLVGARGADAVADGAGLAHVLFGWDAREALGPRARWRVGTSADDTLGFDGAPLISAAGGNGTDTLAFEGAGLSLDLRDRALRVESIEVVDVRGSGDNTLFLDDAAVRRLPATRAGVPGGLAKTLVVLADEGDTVYFDSAGYSVIGSNAGRDVYQKTGAFYGLEVSPGVDLTPPSP